MNIRRTKHLLYFASTGLVAGAMAVIAWTFVRVPAVHMAPALQRREEALTPKSNEPLVSLEALQAACLLELRRPLIDPPPQPMAATPAPAPLGLHLAGTVLEPGQCRAMFLLPDGKIELKRVGETSSGAQVLSIDSDGVTVMYQGRPVTLKLLKRRQ